MGKRPFGGDALDNGARITAAHSAGVDHAGQCEVVGKQARAQHLFLRVHAGKQLADFSAFRKRGNLLSIAQKARGQQNGMLNFFVARTAADIAANGLFNV